MSGGILTIIDQLNHNNDNTKISAVCIGKQISFFSQMLNMIRTFFKNLRIDHHLVYEKLFCTMLALSTFIILSHSKLREANLLDITHN